MSLDKKRYEAQRWLETAQEDLEAAQALSDKQKYSHSCFFAQQSAKKPSKHFGSSRERILGDIQFRS
jgi:hypothetical protein